MVWWVPPMLMGANNFFIYSRTLTDHQLEPMNLRAYAVAAGWNQVQPLWATINFNEFLINSNTTSSYAFHVGPEASYPVGSRLILNMGTGSIIGAGGRGGLRQFNTAGLPGGGGLDVAVNNLSVIIRNGAFIAGGGGGGGAGTYRHEYGGPGAGSGGAGGVFAGAGGTWNGQNPNTGTDGNPGSFSDGGAAAPGVLSGMAGGKGGNLGQAGSPGLDNASWGQKFTQGGAAGIALRHANNITFEGTAPTILGPVVAV